MEAGAAPSVTIDINKIVTESMNRSLHLSYKSRCQRQPTIFRIPAHVQRHDIADFDPIIVSIGPYHHGKQSLQPMQAVKWEFLHDLIQRYSSNRLEEYIKVASTLETMARSHYSRKIKMGSREFIEMLVLDGCFVLEFMIKYSRCGEGELNLPEGVTQVYSFHSRIGCNMLPLLRHDLLLMENQIPFFVLEQLFHNSIIPIRSDGDNPSTMLTLMQLALHYVSSSGAPISGDDGMKRALQIELLPTRDNGRRELYHLLHLSHAYLVNELKTRLKKHPEYIALATCGRGIAIGHEPPPFVYCLSSLRPRTFISILKLPFSLCLYAMMLPIQIISKKPPYYLPHSHEYSTLLRASIPKAVQLREAGVQFVINKQMTLDNDSKDATENCFLDISFDDGMMQIPAVSIDINFKSLLRNLLVLEQYCLAVDAEASGDPLTRNTATAVTAYLKFMGNLIDEPEDVRVLQSCGIIKNKVGGDEDAADFFNRVGNDVYLDHKAHYLGGVFKEVNRYLKIDHHKWRVKLFKETVGTPWAVISLGAAGMLLCLTFLPTLYTVRN